MVKVIKKMSHDLRVFIGERFSLKVSIPLAVVLFLSPYLVVGQHSLAGAIFGSLTVFTVLMCLRIVDDVLDIDYDKEHNGDRALPSGRVDKHVLNRFVFITMPLITIANFLTGFKYGSLLIGLIIIYYGSFFIAIKGKLPKVVRPLFSNIVFVMIPVYAGIVSYDVEAVHVILALFIYFAVIAHEWAHNVKETQRYNNAAIIAFVLFTLSGLCGWIFWFVYDKPSVFGAALFITSIQMLVMCMRLVISPSRASARKFYIAGFTFFAVPLIGLIVDNLAVS